MSRNMVGSRVAGVYPELGICSLGFHANHSLFDEKE